MTSDKEKTEPPPETSAPDPALALIGLALCEASGKLHLLSLLLLLAFFGGVTFLAVFMKGTAVFILLGMVILTGLETFFAWRLSFDRPIFAAWAMLKGEAILKAQQEFDAACAAFSKPLKTRSMQDRLKGVKRLSLFQIAAITAQAAILTIPFIYYAGRKFFE